MKTTIVSYGSYSIPTIENYLTTTSKELDDYVQLQGQQDGQKEDDISEPAFTVKLVDYVQIKVQQTIDFIRQTILITSHVLHVKDIEQTVKVRCEQTQRTVDDKEHQVKDLERKKKGLVPDPFKYKYGTWLLPVAVFVGVADAVMAFGSFRGASYSTTLSLISSMAIGLVIAGSHIVFSGWIQISKGLNRIIKVATVLLTAFIFFYWISSMRVAGITNTVSIAVPGDAGVLPNTPHLSQWAICGISFVLFAVVMFLSLVLLKTKEERLQHQEYKQVSKKILYTKQEITKLTEEISNIRNDVAIQKQNARLAFDYFRRSIQTAKTIGKVAIANYKKNYARFHGTVPSFFRNTPELVYDESFDFSTAEKSTT